MSRNVVVALSIAKEVFTDLLKVVKVLLFEVEKINPWVDRLVDLHLVNLWHVFRELRHDVFASHFPQNEHPYKTHWVIVRHENDFV